MRGIAVTGQPDIDQATAEIAVVLRDAGYGKREQDCYDEAARLRDAIMAGTRAQAADGDVRPVGTVVIELANVQVLLTDQGFYARCTRCPWVTETTHAKHVARRWAQEHEDGKS